MSPRPRRRTSPTPCLVLPHLSARRRPPAAQHRTQPTEVRSSMQRLKKLFSSIGFVAILTLVGLGSPRRAAAAPTGPERPVLCWYMVCFFNSVEVYKQEMELAQRHGIDGFLLDVGGWQEG